ncbi:Trans-L-3-hydroxyproline dehydratase [Pleurostoma richardsiae]|uniref:trans-L-3-hydroxyproline dehydratase n=1 Tax=Pleurostoma richardsiae TaxID=41990 RepID=A0AA38VK56_9PEZI|nr:Trans-L-3-hydroxyproline dehydratase [Pleurostoma richardsiae]
MDLYDTLGNLASLKPIRCIDMHTTGEATRIILSGFPEIPGTLLEQRKQYREKHDQYRKLTMLEPRGHEGMYGALIIRKSELITSGDAHIAVLYLHNEGYSTMCGHAAIALGRFLVDTHDIDVFPLRKALEFDPSTRITTINLHTPCGINKLSVPSSADGSRSDPTKPVSFLSVPSFAGALDLQVEIPEAKRWPQLGGRTAVSVDLSYGGAWYCMVNVDQLGFPRGLGQLNVKTCDTITQTIKTQIVETERLVRQIAIPPGIEWYLYGVMVVDNVNTAPVADVASTETGLCFFADQQVDRSPTGGCVAARMALAYAKGACRLRERRAFNSFVSNASAGRGAFVGSNVEEVDIAGGHGVSAKGVVVRIEGEAFYTGATTFVIEPEDPVEEGFSVKEIEGASSSR